MSTHDPEHQVSLADSATFWCATCGEANEIDVDVSAGGWQSYVEDCQVCCRPNVLSVRFEAGTVRVEAENES